MLNFFQKYLLVFIMLSKYISLKGMDVNLIMENKKCFDTLGIDTNEFEKNKNNQFKILSKAYHRLAATCRPGLDNYDENKWNEVSNSYNQLKSVLESISQSSTLQQRMLEARKNSLELIGKADKINQPDEARELYEKSIEAFKQGTTTQESTVEYGFDIIIHSYASIVQKYLQNERYPEAVGYGKQYLAVLSLIIQDIQARIATQAKDEIIYNFPQFDIPGHYNALFGYNAILEHFSKLQNFVLLSLKQVRMKFEQTLDQTKKNLNSNDTISINEALDLIKEYSKYEFEIGQAKYFLFLPEEQNEYVKGYLKLADAHFNANNAAKALEALEKGLELNNKLAAEAKLSINFANDFQNKLNTFKQELDKNRQEIKTLKQEINQADKGLDPIATWQNILPKLYKLPPEADKLIIETWNKIIERAENIGDIEKAYIYTQNAVQKIKENVKNLNYTSAINRLQTKIQNLNQKINDQKAESLISKADINTRTNNKDLLANLLNNQEQKTSKNINFLLNFEKSQKLSALLCSSYALYLHNIEQEIIKRKLQDQQDINDFFKNDNLNQIIEQRRNNVFQEKDFRTMKRFIAQGADPNFTFEQWGDKISLLTLGIIHDNNDFVNFLLKRKVNPDQYDSTGETPLHRIMNKIKVYGKLNNPQKEMLKSLIDAKANINIQTKDDNKYTPLDLAYEYKASQKTINSLMTNGARESIFLQK